MADNKNGVSNNEEELAFCCQKFRYFKVCTSVTKTRAMYVWAPQIGCQAFYWAFIIKLSASE